MRLVHVHAHYFPGALDRELELMAPSDLELDGRPSEQLRRLYLDSVCLSPPALRLALETFGHDRVLFGSDEPFWDGADAVATLVELELAPEQLEAVGRRNAERLFGLVD